MGMNGTMVQYFQWDLPADASLWKALAEDAAKLKTAGVTAVWLPPAYKGAQGKEDVGYGVYDLYDLGEFNQKGSVPTKYGTKAEYLAAIKALHDKKIQVYADIVLNHRIGADEVEQVSAEEFNANSRNQMVGDSKTIGVDGARSNLQRMHCCPGNIVGLREMAATCIWRICSQRMEPT